MCETCECSYIDIVLCYGVASGYTHGIQSLEKEQMHVASLSCKGDCHLSLKKRKQFSNINWSGG